MYYGTVDELSDQSSETFRFYCRYTKENEDGKDNMSYR